MEQKVDRLWCPKHGDFGEFSFNTLLSCPTCGEVRERDLCVECEKHKATMDYSESAFEWTHFGSTRLCNCCYFKKVEDTYHKIKDNYERLKKTQKPCQ